MYKINASIYIIEKHIRTLFLPIKSDKKPLKNYIIAPKKKRKD